MLTCSFQGEQVQDLNLKFTPQHSYHIIHSYLHLQGSISRWSTSGCPCFSLHSSICLKGIVNSHILSLIFYLFFFFSPPALCPWQTVVWHPQRLLLKMTCWFAAMGTPEQGQHFPLAHPRARATVPNATSPRAAKVCPLFQKPCRDIRRLCLK